jgi:HEAT repeat protein
MRNLEGLMAMGVGLVPLHHGTLSWGTRPEIRQVFGVGFPNAGAFGFHMGERFMYRIADPNHPITRGLEDFPAIDETYTNYYGEGLPDSRVLVRTDHEPADAELVWVRRNRNSRICCIQGGHDHAMFENASFAELLHRAILWSAGRLPEHSGDQVLTRGTFFDVHRLPAAADALADYRSGESQWAQGVIENAVREAGNDRDMRTEIGQHLLERLSTPMAREARSFILRMLEMLRLPEAVQTVSAYLDAHDAAHMARRVLVAVGNSEADAALRAALRTTEGDLRVGVVNALGLRRDQKATAALIDLMHDRDPQVAEAAVAALARIGTQRADRALSRALQDGSRMQPELLAARLRIAATAEAHGASRQARRIYRALYGADDCPLVRGASLVGLARLEGEGVLPHVLENLVSEQEDMLEAAIRASIVIKGGEVTRALARTLDDLEDAAGVRLIAALAERGDVIALPQVSAQLTSEAQSVRLAAMQAMATLGDASSVPPLLAVAVDEHDPLRDQARNTLDRLRAADVDQALVTMMQDETTDSRRRAELVRTLATRRTPGQIKAFMAYAAGEDEAVSGAALAALAETAALDQLPAILALLNQAESPSRIQAVEKAVRGLCERQDEREACVTAIAEAARGAGDTHRPAMIRLMAALGTPGAYAHLRRWLNNGTLDDRIEVVRALGQWPDMEPCGELLGLARTSGDDRLRALALRAYLRLLELPSQRSGLDTVRLYESVLPLARSRADKALVLSGLSRVQHVRALSLIDEMLMDDSVRAEAAEAAMGIAESLVFEAPEQVRSVLKKVMDGSQEESRRDQVTALLERVEELAQGMVAQWSFGEGTEGWEAANHCRIATDDGKLMVTVTDFDPFVTCEVDFPGGSYLLQMRMRMNGTNYWQVFWHTPETPIGPPETFTVTEVRSGDEWSEISLPITIIGEPEYIRIDPGGDNQGQVAQIDWIRVLKN